MERTLTLHPFYYGWRAWHGPPFMYSWQMSWKCIHFWRLVLGLQLKLSRLDKKVMFDIKCIHAVSNKHCYCKHICPCHTVGQIPPKCKETSNLMWFSLIWFILVLFVCWNLFCTLANLRIKCVTETKNVKSSFSTWLTHLNLRFLYILGCSSPRCATGP